MRHSSGARSGSPSSTSTSAAAGRRPSTPLSRPPPSGRQWEDSLLPPYKAPLALERRHGPANLCVCRMLSVEDLEDPKGVRTPASAPPRNRFPFPSRAPRPLRRPQSQIRRWTACVLRHPRTPLPDPPLPHAPSPLPPRPRQIPKPVAEYATRNLTRQRP